jgi:nitroreductase
MPRNPAVIDYLKTRRSVGPAFLAEPGPNPAELEEMLTIATRVPDHGKFAPWRLVTYAGDARIEAGQRLAAIVKRRQPELDEPSLENERRRLMPAPLTVGVIYSPRPNPKAPEIEQILSAGNVCFNLCHAAFALGFAATWHTGWFAFDPEAQATLGARAGERFVGFIHIGTPTIVPEDRPRPALSEVVTAWRP